MQTNNKAVTGEGTASRVNPDKFWTFEGDLYRKDLGYAIPLRKQYEWTFRSIYIGRHLRATLRAGEFAWPGGYQMCFITSDGAALSFASVRANLRHVLDSIRSNSNDGWRVVACDINYEDTDCFCAHSGEKIPAAYGEDTESGE